MAGLEYKLSYPPFETACAPTATVSHSNRSRVQVSDCSVGEDDSSHLTCWIHKLLIFTQFFKFLRFWISLFTFERSPIICCQIYQKRWQQVSIWFDKSSATQKSDASLAPIIYFNADIIFYFIAVNLFGPFKIYSIFQWADRTRQPLKFETDQNVNKVHALCTCAQKS